MLSGAVWLHALHFRKPKPGVLPSSPAHLGRKATRDYLLRATVIKRPDKFEHEMLKAFEGGVLKSIPHTKAAFIEPFPGLSHEG